MGAEAFISTSTGSSARQVFDQAVETAFFEYGHKGYTGSLAEKAASGYTVIEDDPGRSYDDALALARKLIDDADPRVDDKRGPAGAIRFRPRPGTDQGEQAWLFFGWAAS